MTDHPLIIADLKPSSVNPGPLTPDRAFTICELIVYRTRESDGSLNIAAEAIEEVAHAWRSYITGA